MNLNLDEIRKALVPIGTVATLGVLASFGVAESMSVGDVVTMALTAIGVYIVPNKK
jgi:hypothetical protein